MIVRGNEGLGCQWSSGKGSGSDSKELVTSGTCPSTLSLCFLICHMEYWTDFPSLESLFLLPMYEMMWAWFEVRAVGIKWL